MRAEIVKSHLGDLPYMKLRDARIFYDLIAAHGLSSILELGFFHGVSTAYLAGAVQENGGGLVTTIDLLSAQQRTPNIEEVLTRCGLRDYVEIFFEPKTFNWRLMKFLEETPPRIFDLCYIDGGHTWVDSGFAFCLARQMLRPGGWIVFDDLPHTFRLSSNRDKAWVRRMPEEEQTVPQVEKVFSLLAMRDPDFDTFRRIGRWGIVHKRSDQRPRSEEDLIVESRICEAANLARTDPELRHLLIRNPALVLSKMPPVSSSVSCDHIRFAESDLWCPLEPDRSENGIVTHFLEKPEWETTVNEASLLLMMSR